MVKSKRAREAGEAEDKPNPVNLTSDAVDVPAKKRKRDSNEDGDAEVKKAKKDKKEKKDKKNKHDKSQKESRRERKDKRKDLQDLPEQDSDVEEEKPVDADITMADASPKPVVAAVVNGDKEAKKEKKSKKEKKDKKGEKGKKEKKQETEEAPASAAHDTPKAATHGDAPEPKREKKKNNKRNKKPSASDPNNANNIPVASEATTNGEANGEEESSKSDRHIVFVGNLPFTATAETIEAHFASLSPISVRCLKNKDDPKPCRGIAFVEFGKVWHMRTCLDKFHHSMFDDGVSPARKINVELTAGGGGKTRQRTEKIKEKNRKLDENRTKRIEKEKVAKVDKKDEDDIHPSRRARMVVP